MEEDLKIFDSEDHYVTFDVSEYDDDEDNTHTEMEFDSDLYEESMDRVSEEFCLWRGNDCIIKYSASANGWRGSSEGVQYLDTPDLKDLIALGCNGDTLKIFFDKDQYMLAMMHHDGTNYYYASKIDMNLSKKVLMEEAKVAANCNCGYDLSEVLERMGDNLYVSNATKQDLLDAIKESI